MLLKCWTQYVSKFGKLSSGHKTGKCQFSFQSQRRAVKEHPNYCTVALVSHTGKAVLRIFPARLRQYVNWGLPDILAGFRKGRGTRNQIANILWILEKTREFQKNIDFYFIDYTKAFDCVGHNKPWKILKQMGIPEHLTCLLRKLYAGQEATARCTENSSCCVHMLYPVWCCLSWGFFCTQGLHGLCLTGSSFSFTLHFPPRAF